MRVWCRTVPLLALAFLLTSLTACSTGGKQGAEAQQKPDYNQTKTMMLDVLHSKEGQDTLKDIVKEPSFRSSVIISEQDVHSAIMKTLSDEKNQKKIFETQMKDPAFAAAMVKASKKEHQELLKMLMKDPEYQQQMLTLMKSPEYQKMMLEVMQSPEGRRQTTKILVESLQNPEFKLLFMEVVKEAIRSGANVSKTGGQDKKQKTGDGQEKQDSSSGQDGGESGGGGEQ